MDPDPKHWFFFFFIINEAVSFWETFRIWVSRAVDPHSCFADSDPAVLFNAVPDPVPVPDPAAF